MPGTDTQNPQHERRQEAGCGGCQSNMQARNRHQVTGACQCIALPLFLAIR